MFSIGGMGFDFEMFWDFMLLCFGGKKQLRFVGWLFWFDYSRPFFQLVWLLLYLGMLTWRFCFIFPPMFFLGMTSLITSPGKLKIPLKKGHKLCCRACFVWMFLCWSWNWWSLVVRFVGMLVRSLFFWRDAWFVRFFGDASCVMVSWCVFLS